MILIEVTAAVDQYGSLETFYLSTDGFTTSPADTPANTTFLPVLTDAGSISLWAFAAGATSGSSALQPGEITANNDGSFDAWKGYSFDNRPVVIRYGAGGAYPGSFTTIFTGTITSVSVSLSKVTISIVDKAKLLDLPVLTTLYAGTNSGPTGLEGLPGDLKGKQKPRVYGKVLNIGLTAPVNASKLTYQVSDRAVDTISAVYDRGLALTPGADYATNALLTAATVTAGTFATCLAEGLFRLGSSPAGQITADATAGGSDPLRTVAQTMDRLALDAGLTAAEILASDIGELNALAPYVVGLWLNDGTTFRSAMDQIAASAGAWWAFDPSGILRMGRLDAPSGTPDVALIEADVGPGFENGSADGAGIPVWRVTIRHSRFFTTQPTDVAGAVTDARRAELAQDYRTVSAEDASIKIQFAQARELVIDTLLTSGTDAATEAARRLAIHKVRRDLFTVPVPVGVFSTGLMRPVSLTHRRFGLSLGRTLAVLGFELDLARSRVIAKLWG